MPEKMYVCMLVCVYASDEGSKDQVESSSKNLSNPENKDYLTSNYAWITNIQVT